MHNVQTMGAAYYANLYLWGTTNLECCGCIHGKVPASGNCWETSYLQRALRRWPVAGMAQILCPNEENLGLWVLKTFHFLVQKMHQNLALLLGTPCKLCITRYKNMHALLGQKNELIFVSFFGNRAYET